MARIASLADAVRDLVRDGDTVALEGFTHLIPFAAGHEIIRQGRHGLTLVRMTPDVIYDQLIGAGCATKLLFSWGGNPGVGSLHRLRDAGRCRSPSRSTRTPAWPRPMPLAPRVCLSDSSGAISAATSRNTTPRSSSSSVPTRASGSRPSLPYGRTSRSSTRSRPDRRGNVLMWGLVGVQKEAVLAAKRAIVTVEEIVDRLDAPPNAVVLPHWVVSAVCEVKGGAFPSYA